MSEISSTELQNFYDALTSDAQTSRYKSLKTIKKKPKINSSRNTNSSSRLSDSCNYSVSGNSFSDSFVDSYNNDVELKELIAFVEDRLIDDHDGLLSHVKYPNILLQALQELDQLIGMHRLKNDIALQVMRLIDAVNSGETNKNMLNAVLYGPPGVGKTKVGIILSKIWMSLGFLQQNKQQSVVSNAATTINITNNETGADDNPWIALGVLLLYGIFMFWAAIKWIYTSLGLLYFSLLIFGLIVIIYLLFINQTTSEWVVNINQPDYNKPEVYNNINDRDIIKVVSRDDFVAGYLGQTAIKTKKLLNDNKGKVLFIDEAYSLLNDARDSFGMEALTTLNLYLSENPDSMAVIFAGYKDLMQEGIFTFQPGLVRRCMWHFECDEYDGGELFDIFQTQLGQSDWKIDKSDKQLIKNLFVKYEHIFPNFGGDTERLIFYSQLECSKGRLLGSSKHSAKKGKTLTYKNIKEGIRRLKENQVNNE